MAIRFAHCNSDGNWILFYQGRQWYDPVGMDPVNGIILYTE